MTTPLAMIRSYDDLIAAFRARKAEIGLSNEDSDRLGGLTPGHTNKLLGPTGTRKLGPVTLDVLLELYAVELVMVVNVDAARRMEARWERRDERAVRVDASVISRTLVEKAKPVIFSEIGAQLREARKKIKPSTRRRIARQAARARWHPKRRRKPTGSGRKTGTVKP